MDILKINRQANDIYPFSDKTSHPFYPGVDLAHNYDNKHRETWENFWAKVEKLDEIGPTSLYTHTDGMGNPICLPATVVGYCYAQLLLSALTRQVPYQEAISSGPQRNIGANRDWKGISLLKSNYGIILGLPTSEDKASYNLNGFINFLLLIQQQMDARNAEENAWTPIVRSFFQGVDFAYTEAGRKEENKDNVVTQYIDSLTKGLLIDLTQEDRSARVTLEKATRQLEAEGIDFRLFEMAWKPLYQKIILARATAEEFDLSVNTLTQSNRELPDIPNFIEYYCRDNTSLMIFLFLVIAEQVSRDNALTKGSTVRDYIRLLPCTESIIPQLNDPETEFLNDLLATLRQDLTIFNSFVLINRNISAIKTEHNEEDIRSAITKLLTQLTNNP